MNMTRIKFCFLILHYLNIKDTTECVNSILNNIQTNDYKIIIIDNNSQNGSKEELERTYSKNKKIDFICLKENEGFANGNNKGADYAYQKYDPQFYIVINNDTYIKQSNFLNKIEDKYQKYNFYLLGPYIYDKNNQPQNLQIFKNKNIFEINKEIFKINIKLYLEEYNLYEYFFKIKNLIFSNPNFNPKIRVDKKDLSSNEMLHGAAIIFHKKFYESEKYLFYPKTFMYAEEDILRFITLKKKFRISYSPELEIYHKEDGSTNFMLPKEKEKRKFILENKKKSLKVYLELIKKE